MSQHFLHRVPDSVYQMWLTVMENSGERISRDVDGMQTRLRGLITNYLVKTFPGCQITAFAEVGRQDQFNIRYSTGRDVQRGFYLRLKPIPDDNPGLVSLWALEDLSPLEVVTNKQLYHGRSNEELPCYDE